MSKLQNGLLDLAQTEALILAGRPCCIAGDEALLRRLPRGQWIGGTIPYFMAEQGGICTREQLFVTELPLVGDGPRIVSYNRQSLSQVCTEAPEHGFTVLVMPAFTAIHEAFAQEAPNYENMYLHPLVGWISGLHLDDLGKASACVVHGPSGEVLHNAAVAMHVPVPANKLVHVDILNLFSPGDGPGIEFAEEGFSATLARIDGVETNLHDWMERHEIDTQLPLVADYSGAMVNVSIKALNAAAYSVDFYAPVFPDTVYRVAAPVDDYMKAFRGVIGAQQAPGEVVFCCNCILNYAYGGLQGERTGAFFGPMTFGEIGYQLLNQTLVYLSLVDA
jgi:hypothetical protein